MNLLALRRHPPGWLALAVLATAMAVYTWPQQLNADTVRQMLQQPWRSTSTAAGTDSPERALHRHPPALAGGFDPFSRATGTPLPVLASITDPSPQPPGPTQVVRCRTSGRVVYADTWSACPRGMGELVSLAR
jgi:hypothetical protein